MGRTNKEEQIALQHATEMLKSRPNQKVQVQLIKMVLEHGNAKRDYAAKRLAVRNETTGRKPSKKHLSEASATVGSMMAEYRESQDLSNLRAHLKEVEKTIHELKQDVANAREQAEKDEKQIRDLETRLGFAEVLTAHLASAVPQENRPECAAELFHRFRTSAPELLPKILEDLGFSVETWQSWDKQYGDNTRLMVEAFETPEKHEPEKLALLRLKLAALGIALDAINAIRDYRDLKIEWEDLKQRIRSQIQFDGQRVINNAISEDLMPRLSEDGLQKAIVELDRRNDKPKKLQWLEVVRQLLKHDSDIRLMLSMEIRCTRTV